MGVVLEVFWGNSEQEMIKQKFITAKYDSKKGQSLEEYFASQLNSIYGLSIPFTEGERVNTIFRQMPREIQIAYFTRCETMTIKKAMEFLRQLERNVDRQVVKEIKPEINATTNSSNYNRGQYMRGQNRILRVNTIQCNNSMRYNNQQFRGNQRGYHNRGRGIFRGNLRSQRQGFKAIAFQPATSDDTSTIQKNKGPEQKNSQVSANDNSR